MKRAIISILNLCLLLVFAGATGAQAEGIEFEHGTLAEAQAKARESGKLIFVDAYTTWCGPCKYLSAKIFPQEAAGKYFNKHFVNVKLDMEKGEGIAFAKKHNIQSYPTLLWLDADGELAHRASGAPAKVEGLLKIAKTANDPKKCLAGLKKRYEKKPGNKSAAYDYALALAWARMEDETVAAAYRKHVKDDEWISKENWNFIKQYVKSVDDPVFKLVVDNREQFEAFTSDPVYVDNYIERVCKSSIRAALSAPETERAAKLNAAKASTRELLGEDAEKLVASTIFYAMRDGKEMPADKDAYAIAAVYVQHEDNSSARNQAAWFVYENCEDPDCLNGALKWARESVEAGASYANLDTYMRLAFKSGKLDLAETTGKKCLEYARSAGNEQVAKDTEAFLEEVKQAKAGK